MLTCGGFNVLEGARIYAPARGAWLAWLKLDTASEVSGGVTLAEDGGLSLAGTVVSGGVDPDLLRWEGIVVGGAGKLARPVQGAYRQLQLGDALEALASQCGERLSTTIAPALRTAALPFWTLGRCSASGALDALATAAAAVVGAAVTWRVLGDGSIWMGVESWPSVQLPADADIVGRFPAERRTVIAATVPALLPGVDLVTVGRLVAVEHLVEPHSVRSTVWI